MKDNLILSVEHSGTRFVRNHLLRGHVNSYHHLVPAHRQFLIGLIPQYRHVFVPLRHPLEIAWSWARKNMPLQLLVGRFDFLAALAQYSPIWIPVDALRRMNYIREAEQRTGMELNPGDWPKVGHDRSNLDYQLTDDDLKIVTPAINRHAGFFQRFYTEADSGPYDQQRSAA